MIIRAAINSSQSRFTVGPNDIVARTGSIQVAGQDILISKVVNLAANFGWLNITGQDATVEISAGTLIAETGLFNIQGQNATISRNSLINADFGALTIVGQDATVTTGFNVIADFGSTNIAGQDASFTIAGTGWAVVGSVFTGEAFTNKSDIAKLNSTAAVLANRDDGELQALSWSGSAFTTTGTNLGGFSFNNDLQIVNLADGEILVSANGDSFQAYSWSSGTFTTNGSPIAFGVDSTVAGSSAARFFVLDRGFGLKCYDLSGGTWSQTGSTLALTLNFQNHDVLVLDNTPNSEIVVVGDRGLAEVRVYSFNGSTFTLEDSVPFTAAAASAPVFAKINSTSFALAVPATAELYHFTYIAGVLTQTAGSVNIVTDLSISHTQSIINTFNTDEILFAGRGPGSVAVLSYT